MASHKTTLVVMQSQSMPGHMVWYICGIGQQVWSHAFGGLVNIILIKTLPTF